MNSIYRYNTNYQTETQVETQAAALQTRNFDTPSDHTSLVMTNHNNIWEQL